MINAHTATSADFDHAAQAHANAFWLWLTIAALVWWFFSPWWAVLPGMLSIWRAIKSVGATNAAQQLRDGTYKVFNFNNYPSVRRDSAADSTTASEPSPDRLRLEQALLEILKEGGLWMPSSLIGRLRVRFAPQMCALPWRTCTGESWSPHMDTLTAIPTKSLASGPTDSESYKRSKPWGNLRGQQTGKIVLRTHGRRLRVGPALAQETCCSVSSRRFASGDSNLSGHRVPALGLGNTVWTVEQRPVSQFQPTSPASNGRTNSAHLASSSRLISMNCVRL